MLEYHLSVNGNKEHTLKAGKSGPQALNIKEKKFDFTEGINTVAIKTKKPYCPNVEFIKISLDKQKSQISGENYDKYLDKISKQKLPDNYAALKKAAIEAEQCELGLKSYKLDNPKGNYDHEMEVDFSHSFTAFVYLEAGHPYTFETKNATSDPILHVFHKDAPALFSRTDDDSGDGYNAKLTFTVPYSSNYRVFVRKHGNPASVDGTCNIYFTGQIGGTYYDDVLFGYNEAVSGTEVPCPKSVTETLNWFTADLTGDSRIWIVNSNSPGKIVAENDDWTGDSDFNWGNASRIRSNLNANIKSVIVSSYTSYYVGGTCDLYMNCKNGNSTITSTFPNLKTLDAIQSAPMSFNYNCISWSGGAVNLRNCWPPAWGSDWEAVSHRNKPWHDIMSFNNFYLNVDDNGDPLPRDTGQVMDFYNNGGSPTDAAIALWGFGDENYTHASVKKPGNNQPHGYDWESKPGDYMRIFHPKDALNGSLYGSILNYYRWTGTYTNGSTLKTTTLITSVELPDDKKVCLKKKIRAFHDKSKFDELYDLWKDTWDTPELKIQSNPRLFANSDEYKNLLRYCKNAGKSSWPLVFDKYVSGDELNIVLIEDLTRKDYSHIMDEVKHNKQLKPANIHPMARQNANYIYYISELLGLLEKDETTGFKENTTLLTFNLYPNPANDILNIELMEAEKADIKINICDLSGKVIKSVSKDNVKNNVVSIKTNDLPIGVYVCKVATNTETVTRVFNIKR